MGADVAVEFDYNSSRASKARLGVALGGFFHRLLQVTFILLIIGGLFLVFIGSSLGWAVIGLSSIPAIVHEWWAGALREIPALRNGTTMDALAESSLLGRIPRNPTPLDIAIATMQTSGGLFYAVRFGITPNFLQNIVSTDHADSQNIWQRAYDIKQETGIQTITAGMVIYALIEQFPEHQSLLAHNHLNLDSIKDGIEWQNHIAQLVEEHKKPKKTGGIGRDWSFGYTPLLNRFGQNISDQIGRGGLLTVDLEAHQEALGQLIRTFSTNGRQNSALIGQAGVGKTTIVQSFAEKLIHGGRDVPSSLKFRQIVMLDAASLIAAAPGRGQLEDLIMRILSEAYAAKNIIICLDDAQLFFEEGIGSVDIANVLLPIVDAGNLRMILTMDEQRYLQISQRNPSVASALNRINIEPSSSIETIRVMQDQLLVTEYRRNVTYTYQSLHESLRLSERYIHDLAMPGRALKLLDAAAGYDERGLVTMNSVQQAIEKTMNVKISTVSSDEERDTLLNLEDKIHKRMINQTRAVSVVSDALRRARAGVRNEQRPIGTFLFLGPTGVGKTELAKSLADVYFGGEDHIIRLDLNEYVRNEDVARLIADGAKDSTSLTAQVMKQPFSVILLDEIEKAHPNVLTTLLQLLDEGILRDEKNREVSFRDTIIIATSNAGADRIREYIERGYKLEQYEESIINELIDSNQFRPEFLNRFDEIVTFTALGKPELLQVVTLMIDGVNKTLANQKVRVEVDDEAKNMLVERGYDPRLGARPMRRVVQRAVENAVAKLMLSGEASAGSTIRIDSTTISTMLDSHREAQQIDLGN